MINAVILALCGLSALAVGNIQEICIKWNNGKNKNEEVKATSKEKEKNKMTRKLTDAEIIDIHERWWSNKTTYEQKFIMINDDYLRDLVNYVYDADDRRKAALYISRMAAAHNRFFPKYAEKEMRKLLKK